MTTIKRYKWALFMAAVVCGLLLVHPEMGIKALSITLHDSEIILSVLPPILILVGLLDVWVPKETVIRLMGDDSGIKGVMFAFILGAIAAGPLFIAFPIAAMLAGKGARLANILFFIGVWTSAKLPMVLFEYTFFGGTFTFIHVSVGVVSFLVGSFIIEKLVSKESLQTLQSKVKANQDPASKSG